MAKLLKKTIINRRIKELNQIFSSISDDKASVVKPCIVQAAQMEYYIEKLTEALDEAGFVEEYQNGDNQKGKKESTESKSYSTMIKNYNAVIRTLLSLLPEAEQKDVNDGFEEFLQSHKR